MLRTLGKHLKEFKKATILTPIFMIFEVIFDMIIPLLMGKIVSNGIEKGDMDYIVKTGIVMVALALLGLLSGIFVLGRDFFLRLYTTDPNVLTFAIQRLLIVTTLELLTSTYEISGGAMRGFGHSLTPALITVVGSCVLRLIWINTVCRAVHKFWVVMIIYPISWVLTGTVMITAYLLLRRKLMR